MKIYMYLMLYTVNQTCFLQRLQIACGSIFGCFDIFLTQLFSYNITKLY